MERNKRPDSIIEELTKLVAEVGWWFDKNSEAGSDFGGTAIVTCNRFYTNGIQLAAVERQIYPYEYDKIVRRC